MSPSDESKRPTVSFNKGGIAAAVLAATLEAVIPSAQAAPPPAPTSAPLTASPMGKQFSSALNMELNKETMQKLGTALKLSDSEQTRFATTLREAREQMCETVVLTGKDDILKGRAETTFFLDDEQKRQATVVLTPTGLAVTTQKAELTNDPNKPKYVPTGDQYSQPFGPLTQAALAKTPEEQMRLMKEAMNQQRAKNAAQAPKP